MGCPSFVHRLSTVCPPFIPALQNSGKIANDVRGRHIGAEEGTGRAIGGRRNVNATMDVQSYEAGQDEK